MASPNDSRLSASLVKKMHGWMTWFWLINFPPVIFLYFTSTSEQFQAFCLFYLALVSIWANVAAHFSGWVAGRVDEQVEG